MLFFVFHIKVIYVGYFSQLKEIMDVNKCITFSLKIYKNFFFQS